MRCLTRYLWLGLLAKHGRKTNTKPETLLRAKLTRGPLSKHDKSVRNSISSSEARQRKSFHPADLIFKRLALLNHISRQHRRRFAPVEEISKTVWVADIKAPSLDLIIVSQ